MREIRFRAYHPTDREMIFFDLEKASKDSYIARHLCALLSNTHSEGKDLVTQYAGLKDCNGVDIYEGDIVEETIGGHYFLSLVTSENTGIVGGNIYALTFCNNLTNDDDTGEWTFKRQPATGRSSLNERMKVIGNVYENPELLDIVK